MTLHGQLRELGLPAVARDLDDVISLAAKKRWTHVQLLEHVVQLEAAERSRRSLERRLSRSKIGKFRPMQDFDWRWPKRIDRALVDSCLQLEFLSAGRNVVLVAPHGLGKTMIAKNIAQQAISNGYSVAFVTASQLLLDLGARDSARSLDLRLRHYAKQGLLVIDEVGYLAYDNRGADLLFQIINLRYEKRSIVLTTNLAFSEWPTIFPSATCATALIDRVVHHADIVTIEGESYRRREAEQSAKTRKERQAAKTGPKSGGSS